MRIFVNQNQTLLEKEVTGVPNCSCAFEIPSTKQHTKLQITFFFCWTDCSWFTKRYPPLPLPSLFPYVTICSITLTSNYICQCLRSILSSSCGRNKQRSCMQGPKMISNPSGNVALHKCISGRILKFPLDATTYQHWF